MPLLQLKPVWRITVLHYYLRKVLSPYTHVLENLNQIVEKTNHSYKAFLDLSHLLCQELILCLMISYFTFYLEITRLIHLPVGKMTKNIELVPLFFKF